MPQALDLTYRRAWMLQGLARERERERERESVCSSPRKPQNVGGPNGPGSLTSSSNPKEEEREREREMLISLSMGSLYSFLTPLRLNKTFGWATLPGGCAKPSRSGEREREREREASLRPGERKREASVLT